MIGGRRALGLTGAVLGAALLGGGAVAFLDPAPTAVSVVRLALAVCGAAFLAAAAAYARDGYGVQAGTHLLAGVGFVVVAAVPEGLGALVGLLCLSTGGFLLVRDVVGRRIPRSRTGPSGRR
ncbi:hypothetical protein [Haloparvum sedimenti]|uniref:hypothetical protein n=1 Tax=Haloparvum sedimenti TaxID=1678448 RepID=UPI00071E73C6|nr:hypothetical protein [Haloparvum sedimenti]